MKLETFFKKFDQFAEAPNAVAKMRELVLGLAVRGKLVEQDPSDEPASELLKQIYAAKSDRRFCAESGEDPTASSDRYPFVIPDSWRWVGATTPAKIISDVGKKIQTKDVLPEGAYPVVDQGKVFIRGYYDDPEKVIKVTEPIVLFGDHTRETKLIDFDFVVGADGVKLLQPLCIDPFYYFLALRWLPLDSRGYGRHFKLLRASVIPLPPLAEQKRIVAKVDELMALCDRLETQQQERDTRHAALARASLARFADAPTPENLNPLFHDSYTIAPADLRKTILTLAVQGKLVPQDVNDEPAKDLLRHVDLEREQLVKVKRIRRQELLGPIADEAVPFSLPESWQWRRLADVCFLITDGTHYTPKYQVKGIPFLSVKDVSGGEIDFSSTRFISEEEHRVLCKRCRPELGDILLTKVGTTGIAVTVDDSREFSIFVSLALLKFSLTNLDRNYMKHLINSPFVRQQSAENTQGIGNKNLVLRLINQFCVPIPPLAEQHRIVAKVDQLMALVDQLEAQLASSLATATNLMEAVVAELTAQQ